MGGNGENIVESHSVVKPIQLLKRGHRIQIGLLSLNRDDSSPNLWGVGG